MKIAIFYHCLFFYGTPPELRPNAMKIVMGQMAQLRGSGLLDACDEMVVGVNGGDESAAVARAVIPDKARLVMHGLDSRSENLTIVEIEKWAPLHPGWAILYFHSKGATKPPGDMYGDEVCAPWREGMMLDLVENWQQCVSDLKNGYDVACSKWLWKCADGSQNISAGNFFWAKSDFISKLPSIYLRDRIKISGIKSLESRWEAEVWLGNGPTPRVKEYRPWWYPWTMLSQPTYT